MFCPNCGVKNEQQVKFCFNCGASLLEDRVDEYKTIQPENEALAEESSAAEVVETVSTQTTIAQENPATEEVTAEESATETGSFALEEEYQPQKNGVLKKVVFGIVALIVIVAVLFTAFKFFGKIGGEVDFSKYPLIYVKDDEVMVLPEGKKESYEIADTDRNSYGYYSVLQLTDNGEGIFFADDFSEYEYDLYFRKTADMSPKEGKGTRVAKDVTEFSVVNGKTAVVYIRDEKLCYSDTKNEKIIDKNITDFNVTGDGKKVVYKEDDGDVYICGFGKKDQPIKIDSDIDTFVTSTDNYEHIYYLKDSKLYLKDYDKQKKKVASDVENAFELGDKIFVLKSESQKLKFKDLIIDDVTEDTGGLIDPDSIEEPDYYDYADYDEYYDAYEKYCDEYQKAEEKWEIVENKENIQQYFEENPFEVHRYTLYALNGSKLVKIDENITSSSVDCSGNYAFYRKTGVPEIEKIKLSEVSSEYDAENKIRENVEKLEEDIDFCVLSSNEKSFVAFTTDQDVSDITVSEDGNYLYLIMSDEEYEDGDLIRYNINSDKVSDKKTIFEEVSYYYYYEDDFIVTVNGDNELVAYENSKISTVSEDEVGQLSYFNGILYFLDDYSSDSGELVRYKNGKRKVIVNDVESFRIFDEDKIAYISDYDDYAGDLYICNKNGKSKLVDEEVNSILYIY